jgi:hypothetical protein
MNTEKCFWKVDESYFKKKEDESYFKNFVMFSLQRKGLLSSILKSNYSYSVNDEKFILQLKLEPTKKLIGGIVGS